MNNNDKNNKIKYFIYARKSSESEDRQMNSIEDQLTVLKKKAELENLEIVEILSESGSAKKTGRKVFNEMLERIHKGEASGILCWKLNRLARNSLEGGAVSHALQTNIIKKILTPDKTYYPSDNVLMMAVELGMATQFSKDLAIDSKRGTKQKAERGWYPSHVPIGYKHVRDYKPGDNEIIKDTEKFELIRKV
jgi:DNA invertase Pin-like site-specific DNA recombinase